MGRSVAISWTARTAHHSTRSPPPPSLVKGWKKPTTLSFFLLTKRKRDCSKSKNRSRASKRIAARSSMVRCQKKGFFCTAMLMFCSMHGWSCCCCWWSFLWSSEAHPARTPISKKNSAEQKQLTLIYFSISQPFCGSNFQVVLQVKKLLLLVVFPLNIRRWSQKLIKQEYPSARRIQVNGNR